MLRLLSPLGELHALPLMSETATATIVGIGSVLELWNKLETLLEFLLEVAQNLLSQLFALLSTDDALSNQFRLILLRWRWHALDLLVHDRLSETRLIHLVMSVVAIPDHIKHDILPVFAPVLDGEATCLNDSDGVGGVDAEDRHLKAFNQV